MQGFVGRQRYLDLLGSQLPASQSAGAPGKALLLRGRRGVGKTRLVEAFIERSNVPSVFYTASGQPDAVERALFADAVAASTLPRAADYGTSVPSTWEDALRRLADILPDTPSIVVLDEVPYLMDGNPHFEGTLQKVFDRFLSRKHVLLIAVGSNEAVMRGLDAHDRPFHSRATPLELLPLSPYDVAEYRQCDAPESVDAWLLTGGMPLVVTEWERTETRTDYLARALASPLSALVVTGERALTAEVAAEQAPRTVVHTLKGKPATFSALGSVTGLSSSTLDRALTGLTATGAVEGVRPYSTTASRLRHYRVADSYLGWWLEFVMPYLAEIDRGRGELTARRAENSWSTWRGHAVEPLVRESLLRADMPDLPALLAHVGSYWTRNYATEMDVVGGDRFPVASRIAVVGSIKWRASSRWGEADSNALRMAAAKVPGGTPTDVAGPQLVAITPEQVPLPPDIQGFTAANLIDAWR